LLLGRLSGMDEQLDFGAEARRQRANGDPHDQLLVAGEVAAMLRVTTGWVYAQTRAGRMPCVRLGRYYRYRVSAIEAWIDEVERG
jgi:excisionase family DNA binding protein